MEQVVIFKKNHVWCQISKKKRDGKFGAITLLLPFILMIIMFQILPLLTVAEGSLRQDGMSTYSFYNYIYIFKNKFFRQSIINSLEISFYSTIIGLIIAFQGAYSISKLNGKVRKRILLLSNMTSNFSGLPLAFAFIVLLGTNGVLTIILRRAGLVDGFDIYSKAGLTLVYIYFQISLGILLLYPSFDMIREEWYEAASILGATKFEFWRKIALPVLLPSVLGTGILLFANAMGAYATTYGLVLSNYNVIPIRIGSLVSGDIFLKPNLAGALAIVMTLILTFIITVNELLIKNGRRRNGKK
ncbi:MAG: ABC transporter permease subunit [Psychrilyobacter sp.]|uniref:ABC transporter permease n=1 Tax=Psychrilyobacter sp. TaxID=2586924 RepID=UPI003C7561FE